MNLKTKPPLAKPRSMTPLVKPSPLKHKKSESSIRNQSYEKENCHPNAGIRPATPKLTARAWVVVNKSTGDIILGSNCFLLRQIASLTKIMTFMTTLKISEQCGVPLDTYLHVSKIAASQDGTSANLYHGQKLTIEDLLYALMLPSGNDAAVALAEGMGNQLREKSTIRPTSYSPIIPFICQMQQISFDLNLNSKWANSHGLQNAYNKSSAYDVALLCKYAMEDALFRKVVKSKQHKQWTNTNKLLDEGWDGIKTGVTPAAGPCLAAGVSGIIIVLLGCKTMEHRWQECKKLYDLLYIS